MRVQPWARNAILLPPFLLFYTPFCSSLLFFSSPPLKNYGEPTKSAIKSGYYLGGATHKDCIMSQCVTLAQICNYAAQWLLQCEEQFIRISSWIQNAFFCLILMHTGSGFHSHLIMAFKVKIDSKMLNPALFFLIPCMRLSGSCDSWKYLVKLITNVWKLNF